MIGKLIDKLSGTHITIMVVAALFVPGAIWAATYTSVVIQDPSSATRQARVDAAGRLTVVDEYADFSRTPQNFVTIQLNPGTNCTTKLYTVPAGKALIVTAASTFVYPGSGGYGFFYLYRGARGACTTYLFGVNSNQAADTVAQSFGNGIAIPSGAVLSAFTGNISSASMTLVGYLVPAATVPALGTPESDAQAVGHGPAALPPPRPRG